MTGHPWILFIFQRKLYCFLLCKVSIHLECKCQLHPVYSVFHNSIVEWYIIHIIHLMMRQFIIACIYMHAQYHKYMVSTIPSHSALLFPFLPLLHPTSPSPPVYPYLPPPTPSSASPFPPLIPPLLVQPTRPCYYLNRITATSN